jgi:hypothetical protein
MPMPSRPSSTGSFTLAGTLSLTINFIKPLIMFPKIGGLLPATPMVPSSVLDDIVSELWRKENVTSGYCPRYRYTLIATLTLDNLYYICVYFLPTKCSFGKYKNKNEERSARVPEEKCHKAESSLTEKVDCPFLVAYGVCHRKDQDGIERSIRMHGHCAEENLLFSYL